MPPIEPEKRTRTIQVAVQFRYPETDKLPSFSDTLFVPIEEYNELTPDDIAEREQERYDAWAEPILNPPEPEPVVPPEPATVLAQARDALDAATAALEAAEAAQQEPADAPVAE